MKTIPITDKWRSRQKLPFLRKKDLCKKDLQGKNFERDLDFKNFIIKNENYRKKICKSIYDHANHDKQRGSDFGIRKQKVAGKVRKTSLANIRKHNTPK